jgi:hypothetical protein
MGFRNYTYGGVEHNVQILAHLWWGPSPVTASAGALVLFHTTDLGFSLLPALVLEGGLAQDKAR